MFEFISLAEGVVVYHKVDITGNIRSSGVPTGISGGVGIVGLYHR